MSLNAVGTMRLAWFLRPQACSDAGTDAGGLPSGEGDEGAEGA